MIAIDPITGNTRNAKQLHFVDRLFELRLAGNRWDVIDEIVKYWAESNPSKYDSFVIDIKNKRDSRATKYGSNKAKTLRSTLDIPTQVVLMIRKVYPADELPMDKKFFDTMWKRYPIFRVAESL